MSYSHLIGEFNGLPLYFSPEYDNENKRGVMAAFTYYKMKTSKKKQPLIKITPIFYVYPENYKTFILWHEYGHYELKLNSRKYLKKEKDIYSNTYSIIDALAEFYACCKCKLYFYDYIKMIFEKDVCIEKCYDIYERQYKKYIKNKPEDIIVPEYVNNIASLVYIFYRNIDILNFYYDNLYKNYGIKNSKFDWNLFLHSFGWDNNIERLKYVNL